ncbi:MAG: hypothetical protein QM760_11405 [Nibricoccus sp.]
MRAFFVILILAAATACGSSSSDHGRAIVERMSARYDFSALTLFLKSVIRDHPTFDKVPLASTKVEEKWRLEKIDPPSRMRSGDWVIWDKNEENGGFDLYYQFDATHSVTIRAKRLAKDKFEFASLSIEEWISLR